MNLDFFCGDYDTDIRFPWFMPGCGPAGCVAYRVVANTNKLANNDQLYTSFLWTVEQDYPRSVYTLFMYTEVDLDGYDQIYEMTALTGYSSIQAARADVAVIQELWENTAAEDAAYVLRIEGVCSDYISFNGGDDDDSPMPTSAPDRPSTPPVPSLSLPPVPTVVPPVVPSRTPFSGSGPAAATTWPAAAAVAGWAMVAAAVVVTGA